MEKMEQVADIFVNMDGENKIVPVARLKSTASKNFSIEDLSWGTVERPPTQALSSENKYSYAFSEPSWDWIWDSLLRVCWYSGVLEMLKRELILLKAFKGFSSVIYAPISFKLAFTAWIYCYT